MDKAVKGLVGILAAGLVVSIGLAFSGAGVHPQQQKKASEQAASTPANVEATIKSTCTACHGADLKGQVGPNLYNVHTKYKKEEIVQILKNGRGGMPAGLVPGQEEAVANYLMNLK